MDLFLTSDLLNFFILALVIIACIHLYIRVARQFSWKVLSQTRDHSGKRVVSGAGFIFPLSIFLIFLISETVVFEFWMIGLLCLSFLSWLDDFNNLPAISRLVIHVFCIASWFLEAPGFEASWFWMAIVLFLGTGWINAFNFLDGINGMLVLTSLISLGTFYFVGETTSLSILIISQMITVLILAFFNLRKKAIAFAGDVGSITMGFFLGYLMWHLIRTTGNWEYILFFIIFLIDAGMTMLIRLIKKENIFKPHEQHLYQIIGKCHPGSVLMISSMYALSQLIINIILIALMKLEMISLPVILSIIFVNLLIYSALRIIYSKKLLNLA